MSPRWAGMLAFCASLACALAGAAAAQAGPTAARSAPAPGTPFPAPRYFPPLQNPPLDPPLRLTGSFGEFRSTHFHAGLDLSTGEQVGRPVYASLPGEVVRVRASGTGYGRSIYVQAEDGRLLVYAHLDAFDEPLASFVDSVQTATARYEQDLWPGRGRLPVRAGQRLGWSGRSGTVPPHLHFEIRRGDVAYNPLLAGLEVEDTVAPVLRRVTLEPLGGAVRGRPVTRPVTGGEVSLPASGAARLIVDAVDARANGRLTMAPWIVRLETDSAWVECRFDSVSWAEGMSEVDYVYDRGRATGDGATSMLLYAPEGFRPRVLGSSVPAPARAGLLPGPAAAGPDRSSRLRLRAWDVAGNEVSCRVSLTPAPPSADPAPPKAAGPDAEAQALVEADSPAPAGGRAGTRLDRTPRTLDPARAAELEFEDLRLEAPAHAVFEPVRILLERSSRAAAPDELRRESAVFGAHPYRTPLRAALRIAIAQPGGADQRTGLYRESGEGWEWLGATRDPAGRGIAGESRRLGRFALFRDVAAPRIDLLLPPRTPPGGDYPRWELEAALAEEGSGVDARASWFVVDGQRVPSEYDAPAHLLRWRPLRPPAGGSHEVEVHATDRAGNTRRLGGTFVLD